MRITNRVIRCKTKNQVEYDTNCDHLKVTFTTLSQSHHEDLVAAEFGQENEVDNFYEEGMRVKDKLQLSHFCGQL